MKSEKQLQALAPIFLFLSLLIVQQSHATVTVKYGTVLQTLSPYYHGVNFVGVITWDKYHGSTGSMNALKRAGVQVIRFPGGNPGDGYNWKVPGTANVSYKEASTYAKSVGAKLLFQTNAEGSGGTPNTAAQAAAWVDSCKANSVDVPYWEIGNEPEYWTTISPGSYFSIYNSQATAMKPRNSAITIMGPASGDGMFTKLLLDSCAAKVDAISIHWYTGGGWNAVKSAAQEQWPIQTNYYNKINTTNKPLWVTEWSILGAMLPDVQNDFNKEIGSALAYIDVIGEFMRTGIDGYTMFGCIHGVDANWGILCGDLDYRAVDQPGPGYFVFPICTKMGNQVLDLTNTDVPDSVVSAYASKKSSDGSVQVLLINKTGSARSTAVNFQGYNPNGATVQIYELKSSNGSVTSQDVTYNGTTNPTPATNDLPAATSALCSGTSYTRSLPAYSATLLYFTGGTSVTGTLRAVKAVEPLFSLSRVGMRVSISVVSDLLNQNPMVSIYRISGEKVATLSASKSRGIYSWDASKMSQGSYVLKLSTNTRTITGSFSVCQ